MRRINKLLAFALGLFLWCAPALAQSVVPVNMRDANLTTTATQNLISTLNTFTAPRTLTIPGQGALSSYYLQFADTAFAINGANTLIIRTADGSLINGGATLTLTLAGAYAFLVPSPSGYFATVVNNSGSIGTPGGTNGQIEYNQSGVFGGFTASGDLTINTTTGVATFTTVNANVGAFGSNVNCTTYTVNAKGLITAASQTACTPAVGSITGFGTGVGTALAVNVGSAGAPVLFNGAGGTPSSMTLTNATGLPIGSGVSGLGAGCVTWLGTPSSANLRACLTDETGTGFAYFQGGDIGTPSAGVATNITALNATQLTTGTIPAGRFPALTGDVTSTIGTTATTLAAGNAGNLNSGTLLAARMPALTGDCTSTVNTVATACFQGSWTTYTPTVTSATGTLTTASATGRYKLIGNKTVLLEVDATVTTAGTGAGALRVTLPFASANANYVGTGYEYAVSALSGAAIIRFALSTAFMSSVSSTGTTFIANGASVMYGITYELP